MNQEELTIDLKDLLRRCVEKWKFIVVCMLIGALLVDGVQAWSSVKKAKQVKAQLEQQENADDETTNLITLKEYMSKLTEREISEVQTAFSSYKTYQQEYVNGLTYCQNSVRMQLNPNKIPTVHLGYMIDNHYETEYPVVLKRDTTEAIINTIEENLRNDELSQQIASCIGFGDNTAYAQELISADTDAKEQGMLLLSIIAESQEDCQQIAEIVKQAIDVQTDAVRAVCGDFNITLTTEQYVEETDSDLMMEKQSKMLSLNNLKNSINNLTAGMTEEQVTYYKALRDNEESIVVENPDMKEISEEAEKQTIEVPAVVYVSLKWLVMGLLVGAFLSCGWIALCYMLADTLRVASDMEEPLGISVLGCITDKSKKKLKIFRSRFDEFDTEKQLQMVVAKINAVAEKEHYRRVFIGGTGESAKMQEICENVISSLNAEGITCSTGCSLMYDANSVKKMTEMDAVVFVEQIDKSRYEEIQKAKELSEKCHLPVMGCIVIE